ncbi:unnamed protein product [Musa acuminata subsp. burmannicoides]
MEAGEPNVVESSGSGSTGKFRRICVFCGSRSGNRPSFSQAALDLGKQLVERKIDLVYGGGSAGLMGLVSKTVFDGGCHVLGYTSPPQITCVVSGETIGDLIKVADMHERKSEMAKCADAFIALPGGYGTMEELLEIIAHSQLGIHHKPVGLLNVDGYYDSLLALFDKGVEQGFIEDSARHIVASAESAEELLRKMEITCRPSAGPAASWPPHVSVPSSVSHVVTTTPTAPCSPKQPSRRPLTATPAASRAPPIPTPIPPTCPPLLHAAGLSPAEERREEWSGCRVGVRPPVR